MKTAVNRRRPGPAPGEQQDRDGELGRLFDQADHEGGQGAEVPDGVELQLSCDHTADDASSIIAGTVTANGRT